MVAAGFQTMVEDDLQRWREAIWLAPNLIYFPSHKSSAHINLGILLSHPYWVPFLFFSHIPHENKYITGSHPIAMAQPLQLRSRATKRLPLSMTRCLPPPIARRLLTCLCSGSRWTHRSVSFIIGQRPGKLFSAGRLLSLSFLTLSSALPHLLTLVYTILFGDLPRD